MLNKIVVLFAIAVALTGCFFNEPVGQDQQAVKLDGGKFVECVGSGIHTDLGPFADLVQISSRTINFLVSDPQVATKDSQLVGVELAVQVRRKTDCESMQSILRNWPSVIDNDDSMRLLVEPATLEAIKVGTREFSLDELLNDRNKLADGIRGSLIDDAGKFSSEIVNVQVKNVQIDDNYAQLLQQKANLTAEREVKVRQQEIIRQDASNQQLEQTQQAETYRKQLEAEKAKTDIEVEIAKREGSVIAAQNQVYSLNPQAFEIKRLELLAKVLGDKATMYFIPQGTSLSVLLGQIGAGAVISP